MPSKKSVFLIILNKRETNVVPLHSLGLTDDLQCSLMLENRFKIVVASFELDFRQNVALSSCERILVVTHISIAGLWPATRVYVAFE